MRYAPGPIAVLLATLVVAGRAAPTRPAANASEIDQGILAQLTHIATAKIEAEHQALITGDTRGLDPAALSLAEEAAAALEGIAQRQLRRHDGLAQCGARYTDARTTITVQNADIGADRATIRALVSNELTYQPGTSTPVLTSERPKHVFHFTRVDDERWVLTRDGQATLRRGAPPTHWWDQPFSTSKGRGVGTISPARLCAPLVS